MSGNQQIKSIKMKIESIEEEYLPYFLSSFVMELDTSIDNFLRLYNGVLQIRRNDLRKIKKLETLLDIHFPPETKDVAFSLLNSKKGERLRYYLRNRLAQCSPTKVVSSKRPKEPQPKTR